MNRWQQLALRVGLLLLVYLTLAYLLLPALWRGYARRHQALEQLPGITYTRSGIPGDPINVLLIGTSADVLHNLKQANWALADPLSLRSDLKIAEASVLGRPDPTAPVSSLYLFGRKEDLAFEQAVGDNPRHRHHVRFWRTDQLDQGRPVWLGSAVYDRRVGLSKTTGQITHVTAPDVDTERDYLFQCLEKTGGLSERYVVDDFHKVKQGKNGGGDPWCTDGRLFVGAVTAGP